MAGNKVFLVSDPGVAEAGWTNRVTRYLGKEGISYTSFFDVVPNPRDYQVEKALEFYQKENCDIIVCIGGGSPMDLAKGVAILAANGGSIENYEGIDKAKNPLPPMIMAPSTNGSGSEVSQFSIIKNSDSLSKMALIGKNLVPNISLIDPLISATAPSYLQACCGMDALTHAIEAYVSIAASEFTDIYALKSIQLVGAALARTVRDHSNMEAIVMMSRASLFAGVAFSNALLGLVHAMAHQLGGLLDIPHGEANAILLPYVMEYNLPLVASRYAQIALLWDLGKKGESDISLAKRAIEGIRQLNGKIAIPNSLSKFNITQDQFYILAKNTMKDPCLLTNPRQPTEDDVLNIFFNAYQSQKGIKKAYSSTAVRMPLQDIDNLIGVRTSKTTYYAQLKDQIRHLEKIIQEKKKAEELIKYQNYHDNLTSLPNRLLFRDRLDLALAQAKHNQQMFAIFSLDLDRFKLVNDILGHQMGDRLLQGVAKRLAKCIHGGNTVARMGGDEFAILLADISEVEEVGRVGEVVLETLKSSFNLNGSEIYVTTSIGITLYPSDGEDAETLLKNSEVAMYRAKERGGSNYQFYTPSMNAKILERVALENSLRHALELEEFCLYYQPQIDINSGKIIGVEALVRWQNPKIGLISPAKFIPLAEETGLIIPLGEYVLRSACIQSRVWQKIGLPPLKMAVNLSIRQFQQENLVEMIAGVLSETGLDPQWLELEITESVAMKDVDFTINILRELRDMGIQIAIDDFGTGYSSLNYLKNFPINTLKIDKSFVRDITINSNDAAIAATIIVLAHNLNLSVTAEGVETQEQLQYLKEQKCDKMQGYLFSRPLPCEEIEKILITNFAQRN